MEFKNFDSSIEMIFLPRCLYGEIWGKEKGYFNGRLGFAKRWEKKEEEDRQTDVQKEKLRDICFFGVLSCHGTLFYLFSNVLHVNEKHSSFSVHEKQKNLRLRNKERHFLIWQGTKLSLFFGMDSFVFLEKKEEEITGDLDDQGS